MLDAGSDVSMRNHCCVSDSIVKLLLDASSDVSVPDKKGANHSNDCILRDLAED